MINNIIPAWNSMLPLGNIIKLECSVNNVLISCGVNLVFSIIAIFWWEDVLKAKG